MVPVVVEELRLTDLKRGRPIHFDKTDVTIEYDAVGAFVLDMPATERAWELIQLDEDGELIPVGIVVAWEDLDPIPLLAEDWSYTRTITEDEGIQETLTLVGPDMLSLLANRIAYPTPAAAWDAQTLTSATYTGPAETVIKDIVRENLVDAGDTDRRVPLLTIAPDLGLGGTVTYKVVPPDPDATTGTETSTIAASVMDMVRAVDDQSPIGVRITLGDGELVFDTYIPRDLTGKAVFSADLGNLAEASLTVSAPTVNAVLQQSKVTGAPFTQASGLLAADPWRRVEVFADQSSTDTAADVTTAGATALAEGAGKVALSLTATDLPRLRFGADATGVQGYREGDRVTADIHQGVSFPDVVGKVQLVADATSDPYTETVTPTIGRGGDSTDQTISARVSAQLRSLERRLRGNI